MKNVVIILLAPLLISVILSALITVRPTDERFALDINQIDLNQYLIIDARAGNKFQKKHIPNAVRTAEIQTIIAYLNQHKQKPVLIYCQEGCAYSKILTEKLRFKYDFKEVFHLKGGYEAWSKKSEEH